MPSPTSAPLTHRHTRPTTSFNTFIIRTQYRWLHNPYLPKNAKLPAINPPHVHYLSGFSSNPWCSRKIMAVWLLLCLLRIVTETKTDILISDQSLILYWNWVSKYERPGCFLSLSEGGNPFSEAISCLVGTIIDLGLYNNDCILIALPNDEALEK